jgi:all-trans-retinol 13,14-reductase
MRTKKKTFEIPGMLYILISFIPWILYWTLSGTGTPLGIFLGLAVAAFLVIVQIPAGVLNPMDLTSVIFFVLAAIGTYQFNSRLFIDNSGPMGYLALLVMAIISLLVGQPYTMQVSKRDYPKEYWKDPIFLLVNNIITGAWAIVFLGSAAIYLLFRFPWSVIASNILVALGIVFSVIFPKFAPGYFTLRRFRKSDWQVAINHGPAGKAGDREYDVIIVGSGIGGLTSGALLAREGLRVTIFEQHSIPGGYCSSFYRKGFTFNTGVEAVSGLWENGPVHYLLEDLGLKQEDLFIRNTSRSIFKGRNIDAPPNLDGFIALLQGMFPKESQGVDGFFNVAKKAYEETYREANIYGTPLPAELIAKVFGPKVLLDYPREHPHFYGWINKTYQQALDEHIRNEDLKTLLSALIGYVGTEPDKTPATSALTAVISYYLHGGYFPKGGALRFAKVLEKYIEDHGGRVMLRHGVDRILVAPDSESNSWSKRGKFKVKGVHAGGEFYASPIVIANVNAKTTFLELIGEEYLDASFAGYIKGLAMSPSVFMVFLGVNMDLSNYPVLIHNLDEGYGIVIGSNADPSLAPPGKASVTLLTGARYRDFPPRGTSEYLAKKQLLADALIQKVEKLIPGLAEHIIVCETSSPRTLEFYTRMPEGAIYAFDQSKDTKRPFFKSPIRGLYLAGASTFPGGGIEAVIISGRITANDIIGWKRRSR